MSRFVSSPCIASEQLIQQLTLHKKKYRSMNSQEKTFAQSFQSIDYLSLSSTQNARAVFISGFPYDQGDVRLGCPAGAAMGPAAFRKSLAQNESYLQAELLLYDTGDIATDSAVEDAHIQLYEKHKKILMELKEMQSILFSIGGSHDQSYCSVRALLENYADKKIGVINIDAHLDVRPLIEGKCHSGSPFIQMLQNEQFVKSGSIFIEFANKGTTCINEHYQYVKSKGCPIYWLEKNIRTTLVPPHSQYTTSAGYLFSKIIDQLTEQVEIIFISVDTDSIDSRFMPGVSALSVGGLSQTQIIEIMDITGKCSKVKLVDFSEFNPAIEERISSIMLVSMFYQLCKSLAQRK